MRVEEDGKMKEKRLADDGRKKRASRFLFWGRASQAKALQLAEAGVYLLAPARLGPGEISWEREQAQAQAHSTFLPHRPPGSTEM